MNNSQDEAVTGVAPPPTPVSARAYTDAGLPWFDLYDEDTRHIAARSSLAKVRSLAELDDERTGAHATGDQPLNIADEQVRTLRHERPPTPPHGEGPAE